MVERPLLFTDDMVSAILAYKMTETRRLQSNLHAARVKEGDHLWVREAWANISVGHTANSELIVFRAADTRTHYNGPWRPSIHLPRSASRIFLRVTSTRNELLHDITETGALAEGIVEVCNPATDKRMFSVRDHEAIIGRYRTAIEAYRALWDIRNPQGLWASNPVVRVISFEIAERFTSHTYNNF